MEGEKRNCFGAGERCGEGFLINNHLLPFPAGNSITIRGENHNALQHRRTT